jgi:hypothetical protein
VLPVPGRCRRFASIMTDRILDNPDYPKVPNEATSRRFFVSLFALMPSSHPETNYSRFFWCQMTPPGRRLA